MKVKVNKVTIQVVQGEILSLSVNALVHATDPNLHLDPVLRLKAGVKVEQECADIGWCDIGNAVITSGGQLSVDKIIHVVGPRWGEGSERGKLANATLACLHRAEENRLKSIAMPAISAGILGYPLENCARTMLNQIIDFTFEPPKYLRTVTLCLDTSPAYEIFRHELHQQVEDLRATGEGEVTA